MFRPFDRSRFWYRDRYKLTSSFDRPPLLAKLVLLLFTSLTLWFALLFLCFLPPSPPPPSCPSDTARFFIHDLPPRFNEHLLRRCHELNVYTDMCPHVANRGLGRPIDPPLAIGSHGSWYATHQFIAEMIFHARAERHPCRTLDAGEAEMFYVPFYGGLYSSSVFREPSLAERDRLGEDLAEHVVLGENWGRHRGADHFIAIGRTAWDFMRADGPGAPPDFGANRLFLLPAVRNMTVLTVEKPTGPLVGDMFGIPYPSYFHPHAAAEITSWQEHVLQSRRTHLFAFVGGPRKVIEKAAVRAEILRQCGTSPNCRQSECEPGSSLCHEPSNVLEVMLTSEFCMQPPGDSFTRRSVFDSVLAGCVPVFFSEHTAYTQYTWYLPAEPSEYSVMVPEERWGAIEAELAKVPKERVEAMRLRVVSLIPSLTYAHPNSSDPTLRDAVDEALRRLTAHVRQKVAKMQ